MQNARRFSVIASKAQGEWSGVYRFCPEATRRFDETGGQSPSATAAEQREAIARLTLAVTLSVRGDLPLWSDTDFGAKMAPYITSDLIEAVRRGGDVAVSKRINLWDGEFFTGGQNAVTARVWRASWIATRSGVEIVATISTTDEIHPLPEPKGPTERFVMKREVGVWKIDDVYSLPVPGAQGASHAPSRKEVFSHPEVPPNG